VPAIIGLPLHFFGFTSTHSFWPPIRKIINFWCLSYTLSSDDKKIVLHI
jgi:hypothetical protein